jgi:hypothetical protein
VRRLVIWILEHAGEERGVKVDATMQAASEILRETVALASKFLASMGLPELAEKMELRAADLPSRPWINAFIRGVPEVILQTPEAIGGNRFR